jgi:prephenate dehydrogenase
MESSASRFPFSTVGIVGLGLMGGSLARALRRVASGPRVLAADQDAAAAQRAIGEGVIDEVLGAGEVFERAELVVLATPVTATVELLRAHHGRLRSGALGTDLSSVKRPVMAVVRELGLGDVFVGGHPVAGDHRGGFGSSRAELYAGARVWLTPDGAGVAELERLEALWRALGARPQRIGAAEHDELLAWASHLPQLAASALGITLARGHLAPSALGPGGRDTTRLAASPPPLWTEILLANADLLDAPLTGLLEILDTFAVALRERNGALISELLGEGSQWLATPAGAQPKDDVNGGSG